VVGSVGNCGIKAAGAEKRMQKKEAAAYLGVSERTLERYAGNGIGVTYEKGKTKPTPIYNDEDLRKLKAKLDGKLAPRPAVEKEIPSNATTGESSLALMSESPQRLALLETIRAALTTSGGSTLSIGDKIILTLSDAAQLTSLSQNHLRQAIKAGNLKARIVGRGYKIKRSDLNDFAAKL
jgi:excisionase family DNA binding protein